MLVIFKVCALPETAQASAICDMFFHLLTESLPRTIRLFGILNGNPLPVSDAVNDGILVA
jgi:hypothetical protein